MRVFSSRKYRLSRVLNDKKLLTEFTEVSMRIVIVAVLLMISFAFAAGLQDARELYTKGEFQKATAAALAVGGSNGLALAAKSNSIFATTRLASEQEALFVKSESYAQQAIKLDDKNDAGYVELAQAIGQLAELRGALAALFQGVPSRIRDNLEKAISLNPNNATALMGLGAWNAEIAASGAGFLFGADVSKVAPLMEKAIMLEPDEIVHYVEYAHSLVVLDKVKNKTKATALLEKAVTLNINDAAEALDLKQAQKDLAALKLK
jgi:tetratricopeptide (TPR) repeat protein